MRHAVLDHARELQLVAGPRLVRGERPGGGVEVEVVVLLRRPGAGHASSGSTNSPCSPVLPMQARRMHVRRRLRRALRLGVPRRIRAGRVGSVTRCCARMIVLDLAEPLLVEASRLASSGICCFFSSRMTSR